VLLALSRVLDLLLAPLAILYLFSIEPVASAITLSDCQWLRRWTTLRLSHVTRGKAAYADFLPIPAESFWDESFVLPDVERAGQGTASSATADSTAAAPRSS
jgi:hypothetical protein